MTRALLLAEAAASFVGAPFRLHGRDPASGIDCIGLLGCSLRKAGVNHQLPIGYKLRNESADPWLVCASLSGLSEICDTIKAGDVLLVSPSPGQFHIMIAEHSASFIHAHIGFQRVIREPAPASISLIKHWRLEPETQGKT